MLYVILKGNMQAHDQRLRFSKKESKGLDTRKQDSRAALALFQSEVWGGSKIGDCGNILQGSVALEHTADTVNALNKYLPCIALLFSNLWKCRLNDQITVIKSGNEFIVAFSYIFP